MILRAFAVLCVACLSAGRHAWPYRVSPADRGAAVRYDYDGVKELSGLGLLSALGWGGSSVTAKTKSTTKTTKKTTKKTTTKTKTTTTRGGPPDRLRLLAGFFHHRPNATAGHHHHVTYRARDADGLDNGTAASAAVAGEMSTTTTTTAVALDPAGDAYATEQECESANDRRPCVCLVPDFLEDLLDDARTGGAGGGDDRRTAECPSYKAAPKAFVVSPAADAAAGQPVTEGTSTGVENTTTTDAAGWIPVDFDRVIRYRRERSDDDHSEIHYGLTGTDVKVKCLVNGGDSKNAKSDTFKWDYVMNKHTTNSTVTITSTGTLLISNLDPADSKNYTCLVPSNDKGRDTTYVHDVLAVERPLYYIGGKAFYNNVHGGCTRDIVVPFREQLPSLLRDVLCQRDDQSENACHVAIETLECSEDKVLLEIDYRVTLNDNANFLTLMRTTKYGRNATYNQKMLARTCAVLVANLKKLLTVQIISKYSPIDTLFEPDSGATRLEQFVACTPGFGVREVFCAACQVHHYSPDRSAECVKCPTGYHQPIAGSAKCVKCPNVFASGCEIMNIIQPSIRLMAIGVFLLVGLMLVTIYLFNLRKRFVKSSITKIPKAISNSFGNLKKKFSSKLSTSEADGSKGSNVGSVRRGYEKIKNMKTRVSEHIKKGYRSLSSSKTDDDDGSSGNAGGSIRQKIKKFNNMRKRFSANKFDKLFKKKSNHVIVTPKIPFEDFHNKIGRHYEKHRKPIEPTTPHTQQLDNDSE